MNSLADMLTVGRGRSSIVLLCVVAAALVGVNLHRGSHSVRPDEIASIEEARRALSVALADGGCEVTRGEHSEQIITPAWQASYPGSGARMTYFLIEALTGLKTNNDNNIHGAGYETVVSVKTHYPAHERSSTAEVRTIFPDLDKGPMAGSRAVVILRNPLNAIPSLFNLEWELLHGLPNHSTRGTTEGWLMWRVGPHGVNFQLQLFENFVTYWMTKYEKRSDLLIVSYEELTDPRTGPSVAADISAFLGQMDGVDPIGVESIPCVWENVVNYKSHDTLEGNANPSSLRSGPKVRPYSEEMLGDTIAMLERLLEKFQLDSNLPRILSTYVDLVGKTPMEEGLEDGAWVLK